VHCADDECCCERPEIYYTVLARRQVKATRKVHPCTYCGKRIPAGSRAEVTVVMGEGKVFSDYRHGNYGECEAW